MARPLLFILACAALCAAGRISAADEPFVSAANRWAVIIDTITDDAADKDAYQTLRDELNDSGILPDHILAYSSLNDDPAKRPTKENLTALLDGIRNPDRNRLPGADGQMCRVRTVEGPCELQFYVMAGGVFDPENAHELLVPAGIPTEQIEKSNEKSLLPLQDIENALISPEEDQSPMERTFLVVNFISLHSVTRGNAADSPLREIDLARVPVRGSGDDTENDKRFLHLRVLTKNEQIDDPTVSSFYQTLRAGLHGYADLSGNQDGLVQAEELARYIETNGRPGSVEMARNGNDPYPLARSRQEATIPEGLFAEIGRTFTMDKYSNERKSAQEREKSIKSKSKGVLR